MKRIHDENPLISHDLTRIRTEALIELATLHNEQDKVQEAIEV